MAHVPAIHSVQHAADEPLATGPAPQAARWISPPLFSVLAAELFVLGLLIGFYIVLRVSHPELERSSLRFPQWGWGASQLAVVALAWLNARLVPGQLAGARRAAAMVLAAIAAMYGLAGLGLKGLEWTGWGGPEVVLVPAADSQQIAATGASAADATAADPQLGAKAFAATCAACHGANAEGIGPLAPGLKDSEFMTAASDAEVTNVITSGRMANDPASKTGRMMPPRGGNPFLSDADIGNIIAFLRGLSGGAGATSPVIAAATTEAPRWVVPLPPAGPGGLAAEFRPPAGESPVQPELRAQLPNVHEKAFAPLAGLMGGLQAVHLLIGIVVMTAVIWQAYEAPLTPLNTRLARFGRFYWASGVAVWLVLFPLLYVI